MYYCVMNSTKVVFNYCAYSPIHVFYTIIQHGIKHVINRAFEHGQFNVSTCSIPKAQGLVFCFYFSSDT